MADALAAKLGWTRISTDKLARHPGRPWQQVPDHVTEHYLSLSVRELIEDVLRHYRVNVWPQVEEIVAAKEQIVVEGSALWPEFVANLEVADVAAVWLTASDAVFEQRIRAASQYHTRSQRERRMVDKFLGRSLLYNAQMMDVVRQYGLVSMDMSAASVDELTASCASLLGLEQC